ncbi:MAG: hypothetical protein HFH80_12685 [Lachnospiraceae bacterium]|nr:hypothetical protein [Lachnospiraceae bacterium]
MRKGNANVFIKIKGNQVEENNARIEKVLSTALKIAGDLEAAGKVLTVRPLPWSETAWTAWTGRTPYSTSHSTASRR